MITLIVALVGVAASIASSAINAKTQKKIAASAAEIEALELEQAELALEAEQQRTLQAAIKAKSEQLVQLQASQDKAASRNTTLLMAAMGLATYVAYLTLRPAPVATTPARSSKGVLTGLFWLLIVIAVVFWAYVAKKTAPVAPTQTPENN